MGAAVYKVKPSSRREQTFVLRRPDRFLLALRRGRVRSPLCGRTPRQGEEGLFILKLGRQRPNITV